MKLIAKESAPLFSIIRTASSDLAATSRSLGAVQAQGCSDFECIIICDESSAPCIQFLEAAAQSDARLKLLRSDSVDAGQALLFALRQCRGEYIAFCPVDGTLLPGALEFAHDEFRSSSEAGGLCCKGFLIDDRGRPLADANIITLLLSDRRPYLPAGFLRRAALVDCGIGENGWSTTSIELEMWSRIATGFGVRSVNIDVVDTASPQSEVFAAPTNIELAIQERLNVVSHYFSENGFFEGATPSLAFESKINQLSLLRGQLEAFGLSDGKAAIDRHLEGTVDGLRRYLMCDHRVLRSLRRLTFNRTHALGWMAPALQSFLALLDRMTGRPPIHAGYSLWNFPWLGQWLTRTLLVKGVPTSDARVERERPAIFADLYTLAASLYDSRGQIDQALTMWDCARRSNDVGIDGLACQALLKLPGISDAALADRQRHWIRPHVKRIQTNVTSRKHGGGKIRVGYHCAFMNNDTIHFIMRNVIASHDRSRFEIYGYSPQRFVADRTPPFDVFRHTPPLEEHVGDPSPSGQRYDDEKFAALVQHDRLDIFVELSGFSPGHRLVAMAARIAPVQISYLNHLGSTQVPNIDYVLGDYIATPPESLEEKYYSEKIYRLAGCFLSYDYRLSNEPPLAPPPNIVNSFVTFGYFGSGSKLNIGVIEVWAKLLRRVAKSKLHICNFQLSNDANRRFLIDRFKRFEIGEDRLVVSKGVDRPALMKLYAGIDISLDTWPYCGGNTIAESLWQGVPVVTLRGRRFIGAYGASLVTAAGCADLVANSEDDYVELAASLASAPARLAFLRQNLRQMSVSHGLGDSEGFAKRLEAAYKGMLKGLERA